MFLLPVYCFGFVVVGLVLLLCFLTREVPLAFVVELVLVVLNSLSFCLSVKVLISLSNLNEILDG